MWNLHLFIYIHTYIYILFQHNLFTESPKSRRKKYEGLKMHVPYCSLLKKKHFERVTKGTPLGGLSPQNNVRVSSQLINTLSPPGLILLILSALLHELITWQSSESHSKSHESHFFCFLLFIWGVDLLQQGDLLGGVINTYLALTKNNIEDESSNIHGIWMGVNPPLMGCRILNISQPTIHRFQWYLPIAQNAVT